MTSPLLANRFRAARPEHTSSLMTSQRSDAELSPYPQVRRWDGRPMHAPGLPGAERAVLLQHEARIGKYKSARGFRLCLCTGGLMRRPSLSGRISSESFGERAHGTVGSRTA